MKGLTDEILVALKSAIYTYPVESSNIREGGMMRLDGYPSIIVMEIDNADESLIGSREMLTGLGYQVEVYAKNQIVANVAVGRTEIARHIAIEIDAVLRTDLLLKRLNGTLIPFDDDTTRYVLRYECAVNEGDFIYRR